MIDCVIWDLDGTILDTEPCYLEAEGALVESYKTQNMDQGINVLTHKLLGTTAEDSARMVIDHFQLAKSGNRLTSEEYLQERKDILCRLIPKVGFLKGVQEWVKYFKDLGITQAIATSSPPNLLQVKLQVDPEFFRTNFDAIVCAKDIAPGKGKPCPDIFLEAAKRVTKDPSTCLVFEDAPAGIKGAKAAGMLAIALRNHTVPIELYQNENPDQIVSCWTHFKPASFGLPLLEN